MYMDRKEKLKYLRYLIIRDRNIRLNVDQTKIVAGDPSWEPSFWLHDVVKWTSMKKNIGGIKEEDLPNQESPTNFFARLIANAFHMNGENTEKYVVDNVDDLMIKKRKKALGFHDQPQRVDDRDSEEGSDHNDEFPDDEYQLPVTTETYPPEEQISLSTTTRTAQELIPIHNSPELPTNPDPDNIFPSYLKEMIPKMDVVRIPVGGLSLTRCLAEKYNLDVSKLKAFSTKQLLGRWWVNFRSFFKFPVKIFVESDSGERKIVKLAHQYELFECFKSEEYKDACNTGDAEIEILGEPSK